MWLLFYSTVLLLQFLKDILKLFAQSDGVALRREHYAVEGVGEDEYRQLGIVAEFHFARYLLAYGSVLVDGKLYGGWQRAELVLLELLGISLALEQQHNRSAPSLEGGTLLLDVVQGMVGGFLAYTEHGEDVVATASLRQQANVLAVLA